VAALRDELAAIARHSMPIVTLDLSDVTLIDGAGIGALAYLFRHLSAAGRRLVVIGAKGQPLACLRDLGLEGTLGLPPVRRMARRPFFSSMRAA
jgi:anti-anti-sigma regulatory factor